MGETKAFLTGRSCEWKFKMRRGEMFGPEVGRKFSAPKRGAPLRPFKGAAVPDTELELMGSIAVARERVTLVP